MNDSLDTSTDTSSTGGIKAGSKVRITDKYFADTLKYNGLPDHGEVVRINGGYIYVRPHGAHEDNVFELYYNEIQPMGV